MQQPLITMIRYKNSKFYKVFCPVNGIFLFLHTILPCENNNWFLLGKNASLHIQLLRIPIWVEAVIDFFIGAIARFMKPRPISRTYSRSSWLLLLKLSVISSYWHDFFWSSHDLFIFSANGWRQSETLVDYSTVEQSWGKKFFRASMYAGYLPYCELLGTLVCRNNGVGVKYVSLSIDTALIWILWRGLLLMRPQGWPIQIIQHITHTTLISPPPAGPSGSSPLHLFRLSNLSFDMGMPHRFRIFYFRPNQSFICSILCVPRCKCQVLLKKTQSPICISDNFRYMLTPVKIICNLVIPRYCVFGQLNFFQGLLMQTIVEPILLICKMPCYPHWVTFGNIEFHLPFFSSMCQAIQQVFLQNLTIPRRVNNPV